MLQDLDRESLGSRRTKLQLTLHFKVVSDLVDIPASTYEGRAKSSVTNRLPKFYPRYILKCFTALEWYVK